MPVWSKGAKKPDTGIDLWTIGPMVELLKGEQKENKTTAIVVSHTKAFLEAADTLLLIIDGKIGYCNDLAGGPAGVIHRCHTT